MSAPVGFPPTPVAKAAPAVSVVIPAYNYAHYLPRTIESILKQDYPPAEIIVVDDGSTDNTAEVVARYGDKVRRIYQKNAGLPASRNTGIRAAVHDYIAFCDADDEWEPTMLSRLMSIFATLPSDFALVACYLDFIGPDSELLTMKNLIPAEHREITCRDIVLKTPFSSSSLVAKRKVFAECGYFDESLRSSEDRDMWMRIAAKHRIYMTGERLSYIRRHPNNMSKHADRMKDNVRQVIAKAYQAELVPRSDVLFWMRVFSYYFYQNSWRYRDDGRYPKALQQLLCSLLLWPFFPEPTWLNEPAFFRMRAAIRFVAELFRGKPLAT